MTSAGARLPLPIRRGRVLNKVSGFTLIELVVTIAIVVILMAIADPSYKYITNSNRIASEVNGLLGDLQFARSEAIKEGRSVTVCVSSDGATCTNSTLWHKGWIVFSDPNNNASVDTGTGETVLRVQKPFISTDTFQATNNSVVAVTFNREGFASNTTLLKLHDATNNSKWTRCLSVNLSGLLVITTVNGVTCT